MWRPLLNLPREIFKSQQANIKSINLFFKTVVLFILWI